MDVHKDGWMDGVYSLGPPITYNEKKNVSEKNRENYHH